MAESRGVKRAAEGAGLWLEPPSGPAVLRYLPDGRAELGEVDPVEPIELGRRCLATHLAEAKRGRQSSGGHDGDAKEAEERGRTMQEMRRIALDRLGGAECTAGLLVRRLWGDYERTAGEQIRFLRLHRCVPAPPGRTEAAELAASNQVAMLEWPAKLRELGSLVVGSRRHADLEDVLRHLRGRWAITRLGPAGNVDGARFAVEIWNTQSEKAHPTVVRRRPSQEPEQPPSPSPLPRSRPYLISLGYGADGVDITFPLEICHVVQRRHRLAVSFMPIRSSSTEAATKVEPPLLEDPPRCFGGARGAALDAVLCEAREALVDQSVFRMLCVGFRQSACPLRWLELPSSGDRAASAELRLAAFVTEDAGAVSVTVRYGPPLVTAVGEGTGVWPQLGRLAALRLRELYLETLTPEDPMAGCASDEEECARDIAKDFAAWAAPRLSAVLVAESRSAEAAAQALASVEAEAPVPSRSPAEEDVDAADAYRAASFSRVPLVDRVQLRLQTCFELSAKTAEVLASAQDGDAARSEAMRLAADYRATLAEIRRDLRAAVGAAAPSADEDEAAEIAAEASAAARRHGHALLLKSCAACRASLMGA